MQKKTHIRTFYPADPAGVVAGGVDTFTRGLIKWAPEDIEFSMVGMTTDPSHRPVGKWTRCDLGRRQFDFYPLLAVRNGGSRTRIPLSLKYTAKLLLHRKNVTGDFDISEFHRIEPLLVMGNDSRPKNAFFHQDMSVIGSNKSDILWRHFPKLYFQLERRLVPALSSAFCVREEGAKILRERHPSIAQHTYFIPTWVDMDVFSAPRTLDELMFARRALRQDLNMPDITKVIITVGRLDTQKDPALLLSAFAGLQNQAPDSILLFVGDGVLRKDVQQQAKALGLQERVRFAGLQPPAKIAEMLRGADVFALSSNYEGMPMALLEALATGLPAVTTDVGEIRRVVSNSVNGFIVTSHCPPDFTTGLATALIAHRQISGAPCVLSVTPFQPAAVLARVYENYRRLAHG